MALLDVNGAGAIDARLFFPRAGAWHAEIRVDSLTDIAGPATISIADGRLVLKGTVWRGAEYVDTAFVHVVAGADGLRKTARARSYTQTSLRVVLGHLLGDAGEKLSATADAATLTKQLVAWTTAAIPTGVALALALASASPGATWRSLPDGTIWVGPETWPDSGLTTDDYQVMDEDPRQLTAMLGVEAPLLLPGTTLAGRRVSRAEHTIDAEGVRTWVWFEDTQAGAAPTGDRLREAFGAAVRSVAGPVDYLAMYWGRVIAQSGSTIDVELENPTIAKFMPSMSRVPLTMPAAGATVQMAATGRVLVGWSGGDPARPYALAPDADTRMTSLTLNADQLILGGAAGAEPVIKGASYASAESTFLGQLLTYAGAIQGIADPSGLATTALGTAVATFVTATTAALAAKTKAS